MPEPKPLESVDPNRCQGEWSTYNAFIMGGPTRKHERCTETPVWIATEIEPGPDGQRGRMSVCAECRTRMDEMIEQGKLPPIAYALLQEVGIYA